MSVLKKSLIGLTLLGTGVVGAWFAWTYYSQDITKSIDLNSLDLQQTTRLYDANGVLLDEIHGEEHRRYVTLDQIPQFFQEAVIAIEDDQFYKHGGVNFRSVGRAAWKNITAGEIEEGASTITMQLVKNMFLSNERTYSRKLKEVIIAQRVESLWSKEKILEMYLNVVAFGDNTYGIDAAADNYFRKKPSQLTQAEATFLAGIIKGPSFYSPRSNYQGAKNRQQLVLDAMVKNNLLTPAEASEIGGTALALHGSNSWAKSLSPNVTNVGLIEAKRLLRLAVEKDRSLKVDPEKIEEEGLRIYFTVDKATQDIAERVVADGCARVGANKYGNRNVALVSVEPETHQVKAIVGGCHGDEFNRAYSAKRQPGSAMKPFVYLAAFSSGYTPDSPITDAPISFNDGSRTPYQPKNYGGGFSGPTNLRESLVKSRNIPAIIMGQRLKRNQMVIETAQKLGITTELKQVISLPLGPSETIPLEMANAYAALASGGKCIPSPENASRCAPPSIVSRIEDAEGNVIVDNSPGPLKQMVNPQGTAMLVDVMQDIVRRGTGTNANFDSSRPLAGKTGTTDKQADTWFTGMSPQLATAVWVGNDKSQDKLWAGATGGSVAAPIWRRFMAEYHQGKPIERFTFVDNYKAGR